MPSDYDVLFDLAGSPYQPPLFVLVWTAVLVGICLAGLGTAGRKWRLVPALGALATVAVSAFMISTDYQSYVQMRTAMENGNAIVVEGQVHNFRPDASNGNGVETFSVSAQHFEIRSHEITPAFKHTVGRGGPDLSGKCVRVMFVRDGTADARIIWLGVNHNGC